VLCVCVTGLKLFYSGGTFTFKFHYKIKMWFDLIWGKMIHDLRMWFVIWHKDLFLFLKRFVIWHYDLICDLPIFYWKTATVRHVFQRVHVPRASQSFSVPQSYQIPQYLKAIRYLMLRLSSISKFASFLKKLLRKRLDLLRLAEVALDVVMDLFQTTYCQIVISLSGTS